MLAKVQRFGEDARCKTNSPLLLGEGLEVRSLNDEHQGEGGTLVFVAVYITTTLYCWQDF